MYIAIVSLLIFLILFLSIYHVRKRKVIWKICCMSRSYKCCLLNDLVEPFGYCYDPEQDIFTNTRDAWQKDYGYRSLYDKMAPFFGMVFDWEPVYFDYEGRTWRMEFWKGQYGINTGAEIGVYHADTILSPSERDRTHFTSATEEESPEMKLKLYDRGRFVAEVTGRKWWLTIFSMGRFSHPEDLSLDISVRFPDYEMRNAFVDALYAAGYPINSVHLCMCVIDISFTFCSCQCWMSFFTRLHRRYVQWKNKLFCRLYCFVTRPFDCTEDKLLYLYYYLPFAFRHMLRCRRYRHHLKSVKEKNRRRYS